MKGELITRIADKAKKLVGVRNVGALLQHYRDEGMGVRAIAREFDCSAQTISDLGEYYKIKFPFNNRARARALRKIREMGMQNFTEYFGSRPNFSFQKMSEELGISAGSIWKINKDIVSKMEKKQDGKKKKR